MISGDLSSLYVFLKGLRKVFTLLSALAELVLTVCPLVSLPAWLSSVLLGLLCWPRSPATDLDLFLTAGTSVGGTWKQDFDLLRPTLV